MGEERVLKVDRAQVRAAKLILKRAERGPGHRITGDPRHRERQAGAEPRRTHLLTRHERDSPTALAA